MANEVRVSASDDLAVTAVPNAPSRSPFRLPDTFASLRHRNYRLLWSGTLISQSGDWMDQIALNWLVYDLTGSALALALLNMCRLVPITLFTLIGGVAADRVERRTLLFITQSVAMVLALALAVVVSTGIVQFWMVLVVAVGRGVMMSFNQPARQSLISDLVPRELLTNAIALNSATMNLTRIIGPMIGGMLIVTVGVAGAFYVNGLSFVAVLIGLMQMRFPPRQPRPRKSMTSDLLGGVQYLRGNSSLRTLVILALVPIMLGNPYMTMLTVFAKDILNIGGPGLGLLTACAALGAVCGAIFVASRGPTQGRRRLMLVGLVLFGTMISSFALSPWLWLSASALFGVGFGQQMFMALNNSIIQEEVDPEFRGRIVSTLFMNRGLIPLGTMIAGVGTDFVGAPITLGVMGALLVVMAVAAAAAQPDLRTAIISPSRQASPLSSQS
ncbi:MAG: MFS transporter [Chloroflexi bacterium]|nr:MFS transporter [Chloroflexota bacterium]